MKIFNIILIMSIVLVFQSCDLHDNYDIEYYKIKVDSVQVADTISFADTIKIHLFGKIGDNGCYYLDRYEQTTVNNYLNLIVWGRHIKSTTCTMQMPLLNDIYKVIPDTTGNYFINISQPDNSILKDSCYVR